MTCVLLYFSLFFALSAIEAQTARTKHLTDYRSKLSTPTGIQSSTSHSEIIRKTPKLANSSSVSEPQKLTKLNSNSFSNLARPKSELKPFSSPQAGRRMIHENGKLVVFSRNERASSTDSPRVHFSNDVMKKRLNFDEKHTNVYHV